MKIFGAISVVLACALLGYDIYIKAVNKLKFTEGLISGFEFCRCEISFTHLTLGDTLIKCSNFAGEASVFFNTIGNALNAEGAILEKVFSNYSNVLKQSVSEDVFAIIKDTTLQLGTNDVDNQVNLIDSTIEKLNNCKLRQRVFCDKEGTMCKKVSIIVGIAISLMLF